MLEFRQTNENHLPEYLPTSGNLVDLSETTDKNLEIFIKFLNSAYR